MESSKEFIKNHQQKTAIVIGYLLIAGLGFGLGRHSIISRPPEVRIEEPALDLTQIYNNLNDLASQSHSEQGTVAGAVDSTELNCAGKIKGNISARSKIYHLPGGASYKQTIPELCFDTEAAAADAGFRKSQR